LSASLSGQRRPTVCTMLWTAVAAALPAPMASPLPPFPRPPFPPPRGHRPPPLADIRGAHRRRAPPPPSSSSTRFTASMPPRTTPLFTITELSWTAAPAPLRPPSTLPQAPHRHREPLRPPCWHPQLLLHATTVAPRLPLATTATHLIVGRCRNRPAPPALMRHGSSPAPGTGLPAHEPAGWEVGRSKVGLGEQYIFFF
jgi:hypothetical protein